MPGIKARGLIVPGALADIGLSSVSLTDDQAASLATWEQWGTEDITLALSGEDIDLVATVTGFVRDFSSGSFGSLRLAGSIDGGATWSYSETIEIKAAEHTEDSDRIPVAAQLHLAGTATGDVTVKAEIRTATSTSDCQFKSGTITTVRAADGATTYLGRTWAIRADTPEAAHNSWNNLVHNSVDFLNVRRLNGASNADQAWVEWETNPLLSGTWAFSLLHTAGSNRGIYTVTLDGATIATVDGYAASDTTTRSLVTGISVPTDGAKTLRIATSTKNPSSSSYRGVISALSLQRTGS